MDEKQVVFFSEKYAKRARVKREAVKQKAGKILTSSSVLEIDTEKIKKEVALDGYYLIVTSEMEGSDDRIIEFVALTISILLELKTEHRYSIGKLLDSMARSNCIYLKDNLYLFCYYDETLELLSQKTGIKFNHKMLSLGEIKKTLGNTKRSCNQLCADPQSPQYQYHVFSNVGGCFERMFCKAQDMRSV